jgi:hypothetical protein
MFDNLSLVMQELKGQEERVLVSRNPVFVFVFPSAFVHHLVQLEWPGFACLFADIMMVPAREHRFVKALPDCHHEHPSLVPENTHA